MASVPIIIAGHVYQFNSTDILSDVVVAIKNMETGEEHNGAESLFPELTTNSAGEFQANLANFTTDYSNLDLIRVTLNHNGDKDVIFFTIQGTKSVQTLVLTPVPNEDIYDYERGLDEIGSKVLIYRETKTLEDDYKSIETETITAHPIEDDTYAEIQIEEDEVEQMEQGVVSHGEATGFFKVRYNVSKDDRIRIPTDSDNIWIVQNKPVRRRINNQPQHDEARLVRVSTVFLGASAGSTITDDDVEAQTPVYKLGSNCTLTNAEFSRVLTITTASTPILEKVYLDGKRLTPGTDYDVAYNSTSLVITFSGVRIFDEQHIGVDYSL